MRILLISSYSNNDSAAESTIFFMNLEVYKMLIAVYGSPRAGGNTDILMDTFLLGVQKHENVISFKLRDMTLKPCTGCGFCDKSGICIFKDDIWDIYEHLENATGLVLSSPIYFASVTAQLKTFIDRGQAFWVRKELKGTFQGNNQNRKRGFYISVGAMNNDKYFINSRLVVRSFFVSMDVKPSGELFYPCIDKKGEIKSQPGALDSAYQAGIEFSKLTSLGD